MTVSLNQIPQTTVIRILQMIQIPQIVTTVLIENNNSGNGTGDSSGMIRAMEETSDDPGTLMMIRAVTMIREMAAITAISQFLQQLMKW